MKKNYLFSALVLLSFAINSQTKSGVQTPRSSLNPRVLQKEGESLIIESSNKSSAVFQNYGWSVKPVLPSGRWATGPTFSKNCINNTDIGYIYLIGGSDAAFLNTNANTRYNTATGTYSNMAALPVTRSQVTPLKVGNRIFVIGGYSGNFLPTSSNNIYNIATNTWTTGAAMPTAVGDYAASIYKDSLIYFVGGYNGFFDVNTVQIYNTFLNTWSTGTAKSGNAVDGARMGISGNKIVFVGGYSQFLEATQSAAWLGTINQNNPNTIVWSALPAYPAGPAGRLAGGVAFEGDGLVYFAGGDPDGEGTTALNSIYAYNTITNVWDNGPNMPVGVNNIVTLSGIVHNDSLYLATMGGYNGSVVTTSHYWLNLGPAAPQPTVQNGASYCEGGSATLTASNAVTYSWTPGTALSVTNIPNPVTTSSVNITYSVTMTKAYGCPITSVVDVTVNPLPIVTASVNNQIICSGDTVFFSGNGASTYTWTGGVVNNVAFTPTITDTYTVTGNLNGCQNSAVITVTTNPLPAISVVSSESLLCAGSSATLTASGGLSYTWSPVTSSVNTVVVSPTTTVQYTVSGTGSNGCINTATITQNVSLCTGISKNEKNNLSLFPNPSEGDLEILINYASESLTVEIYNILGETVLKQAVNSHATLNISDLAQGLYVLKILDKNIKIAEQKFIKK
jgi:hypothetical protein